MPAATSSQVSALAPREQVDVRTLFRSLGGSFNGELPPPPPWRPRVRLDPNDSATDVTGVTPLEIGGAADGIQNQTQLAPGRGGRPLFFVQVGAAVLAPCGRRALALRERIYVCGSELDAAVVEPKCRAAGTAYKPLPAIGPEEVRRQCDRTVRDDRAELEREVIESATRATSEPILVDGSIQRLPAGNLIGVVKNCSETVYDAATEDLRRLPPGHRSRAFELLPHQKGEQPLWSAYLRLHAGPSWNFGLVRLETPKGNRPLLDAAASACFQLRQPLGSGDRRADRHLAPIRHVEDVLRARRPVVS
jgi:hypothetical protein